MVPNSRSDFFYFTSRKTAAPPVECGDRLVQRTSGQLLRTVRSAHSYETGQTAIAYLCGATIDIGATDECRLPIHYSGANCHETIT
jgi:hypothetical protein